MLIDTHCHLEKSLKKGEANEIIQRAKDAQVEKMITVGTDLTDWPLYFQLAKDFPKQVYWTAGLHPCNVDENWRDPITALPSFFIEDPLPCALGEIGLDHFHLPKDKDEANRIKALQVDAFRAQLEIALQFDCPIVIHSRNAFHECVELIDKSGVDWKKVIFHCFAEGATEIKILNEKGGLGSFTGTITYKNAENVREAALAQGLEKLMIETDAPYLTPVPHRGKPNEPAYVRHTAEFCADLFNVSVKELEEISTRNAENFFDIR